MNTKTLIKKLGVLYPKRLAETFDHVGLQTGKLREDTKTIVLSLDFDSSVFQTLIREKLLAKIDLIITHHPFIFGTKYQVFKKDEIKKELCSKIDDKNIPIYSYHTNFDTARYGMNDALAEAIGLNNVKPLDNNPMARGGYLDKEYDIKEISNLITKRLNISYGLLLPYGKEKINSIAIIGGGGWHGYKDALNEGYDLFISGDCPHHARREIIEYKYNYLDFPHEIEKIFMYQMKKILLSIDSSLNVIIIDHEKEPTIIS